MAPVTIDTFVNQDKPHVVSNQSATITFGEYIFRRLLSIGTKSVFGVPGDFNLSLLEYLYAPSVESAGLKWVGTCNELNAAYAADGYSRYSNKIGCLITTYGVGELSALNGIAGSFAENVKVLHIVGVAKSMDSRSDNFKDRNLHHLVPQLHDSNFKAPNHKVYHDMVKDRVACSVAYLEDIETACDQVDAVIRDIYKYSKPGYIFVPADFADMSVAPANLIDVSHINQQDCITFPSEIQLFDVIDRATKWIYSSKTPAIIGDVLTDRYGVSDVLNKLIYATGIWNFSTVMGKSVLDESNPTYMGQYNGKEGLKQVYQHFEDCDLVLHFGVDINEINNGHYTFTYKPNAKIIQFHPNYVRFVDTRYGEEQMFEGINFAPVLQELYKRIDVSRLSLQYDPSVTPYTNETMQLEDPINEQSNNITQIHLQKVMPKFLNPGDVVVCETGSFQFSVRDFAFPTQLKYISQGFFLSIGMALPAALGVGIAMQDYPKAHITGGGIKEDYKPRLILFEGDGAAQMTIQELSTILKSNIPIEIVIWNNNGYTIERAIMGPTSSYNDIMPWKWTKLFEAFGDFDGKHTNNTVIESPSQLSLKLKELKNSKTRDRIELLEVKLGVFDFPEQLKCMVEAAALKRNKK
ncbi:aro10p [Saccharomyces arboricola H-6]|uniref:Thiamine pyrophosphate-dependent 2-oxo-acid decarboxylase n=1 Tax=Saccharomyces arboricola (strain H-6 / AS 2.3317 / CBS 10644) TaxID=1160507 RepID=J8PY16_SACAR|nr:aro10p [Saccharomyces arboricola H-6]